LDDLSLFRTKPGLFIESQLTFQRDAWTTRGCSSDRSFGSKKRSHVILSIFKQN